MGGQSNLFAKCPSKMKRETLGLGKEIFLETSKVFFELYCPMMLSNLYVFSAYT